jgi:chitin disaccharide deacetylase
MVSCAAGQSRLVPIVHADDCGLSEGITDAIIRCCDDGWLRRTSVVANGAGWDHAVAALRRRPQLPVALHLNLFEGRPIANAAELDRLVDSSGRFHRGFVALAMEDLRDAGAARLRAQIRLELRLQFERFLGAFGDRGPLLVDSHAHYHLLPPVFDVLMELCADYPVAGVRLPREPFTPGVRPSMLNVAKHVVLRVLSRRAELALRARSLVTATAFVGILGSGGMTLEHVRAALARLRRVGASGPVEILFHPGRARAEEAGLWEGRPELQAIYLSAARDREGELLRSPALAELLRAYGDETADVASVATRTEALQ